MIRVFRDCLRRPDLVRFVGVVALLAFVFVVALGAVHAGESGDTEHGHCGVCLAAAFVATPDAFVAPQFAGHVALAEAAPQPAARVPLATEPRRSHAPRGPPSLA